MDNTKNAQKSKGFVVNDRRFWLRDDLTEEDIPDEPEIRRPSYIEDLESKLAQKEDTLREYIQAHKSSVADMDEVRGRLEREVERRIELKVVRMVAPFIEVMDNLNRLLLACQSGQTGKEVEDGMQLVLKQLNDEMIKIGLERIETQDSRFDPKLMEALITSEVDSEQVDMVLEEVRPGFKLGEHLVRPAGVRVGVAKK